MKWGRYPLRWPGRVWTADRYHLAVGQPAAVTAAADRAAWLDDVPVDTHGWWLIVRAPAGSPAIEPERQPEPDAVPTAIGAGLRQLHDRDVDCCPYVADRQAIVDDIAAAVDVGQLDVGALPEPYARYEPERLLDLASAAPATGDGDLVVTHGAPVVASFYLEDGELSGFAGPSLGRLGVADRHHDLAIAHRSIVDSFGPDALFGFYEGYGRDPDLVRLDHYVLLDVLAEAATAP